MSRNRQPRPSPANDAPDQVRGPHRDRSRSRWSVRWAEGGRQRRRTFVDRAEAEQFAAELRAQAGADEATAIAAVVGDLSPSDGTAAWWNRALGHAAGALLAAVSAGDDRGVRLWGRAGNTLSQLARSAAGARELAAEEQDVRRELDPDGSMPLDAFNQMRAVFGLPQKTAEQYEQYKARFIGEVGQAPGGAAPAASAAAEPSEPN